MVFASGNHRRDGLYRTAALRRQYQDTIFKLMRFRNILGIVLLFADMFLAIYIITKVGGKTFAFFFLAAMLSSMAVSLILVLYYQRMAAFDRSSSDYWRIISMRKGDKISIKSAIVIISMILAYLLFLIFLPRYYLVLGCLCGTSLTLYLFYCAQEILYKLEFIKKTADEMLEIWIQSKKRKR